jgi:hypothetical protein
MSITPTVGRVLWFYGYVGASGWHGPMAAIVAAVNGDRVNLAVFDSTGATFARAGVLLVQEGQTPPASDYCRWMPFQAAKTEALEKRLGSDTAPH